MSYPLTALLVIAAIAIAPAVIMFVFGLLFRYLEWLEWKLRRWY